MRRSDQIPSVQPACIQVPVRRVWLWFWGDKGKVNHSAAEAAFPPPALDLSSFFGSPQGHLSEGYGQLCSIYLKLLRTKMEFHTKVSTLCPCPQGCSKGWALGWQQGTSMAILLPP